MDANRVASFSSFISLFVPEESKSENSSPVEGINTLDRALQSHEETIDSENTTSASKLMKKYPPNCAQFAREKQLAEMWFQGRTDRINKSTAWHFSDRC